MKLFFYCCGSWNGFAHMYACRDTGSVVSLQRLAELLKSKKPEDLQEANRLIKNMVKEVCHFPDDVIILL